MKAIRGIIAEINFGVCSEIGERKKIFSLIRFGYFSAVAAAMIDPIEWPIKIGRSRLLSKI